MKVADGWLGQVLDAVQNNTALANKVAIMLTADHGGGGGTGIEATHTDATLRADYTIPFFLFAPGIVGDTNIYGWFENRFDPGITRPAYFDAAQPMRNGDVANIAAALLGLPPVPDSSIQAEFIKPVQVHRLAEEVRVTWPAYLTGWALESAEDLPGAWQIVTGDLSENNGQHIHTLALPLRGQRFFRLRRAAASPTVPNTIRKANRRGSAALRGR